MGTLEALRLPIYEKLRAQEKDTSRVLSSEELINQTAAFMGWFQIKAEDGEMPDVVFFLDKSARPVAHLFRKLFPHFCPYSTKPEIRFINTGGNGDLNSGYPFTGDPKILNEIYSTNLPEMPEILIVDEWSRLPRIWNPAVERAVQVVKDAFRGSNVRSIIVYHEPPAWYGQENLLGIKEFTEEDYFLMGKAPGIIPYVKGFGSRESFEFRKELDEVYKAVLLR